MITHIRRITDWFANRVVQRQPSDEEVDRILFALREVDDDDPPVMLTCRVCGKPPAYQVSADVGEEIRHEFLCGDDLGPYIDLFCNWPYIEVTRL
jgi:hypothetical protein